MHRRIGLVFVLVSVLLALWAVPALAAGPDPTGESNIPRENKITLSVSGKGTVAAAPSTAQITFAVQTTGKTAQEAQRENARILDRVFTELLAFGIDKQDIRTMNYNVWPDYNWKKQEEGQPPEIIGYRVNNEISVTVRKLDELGKIIDLAMAAGVNQVYGVQFLPDDQSALYLRALEQAVAEAQQKARVICRAVGMSIKGVVTVNEGGPLYEVPLRAGAYTGGDGAEPVTPISPGQIAITAQVNIVYEIE